MNRTLNIIHITLLAIYISGCYIFYLGFFPISISTKHEHTDDVIFPKKVPAKYTHLIIMLIDAFRTDFVFGDSKWLPYMSYTRKMIKNNMTFRYAPIC